MEIILSVSGWHGKNRISVFCCVLLVDKEGDRFALALNWKIDFLVLFLHRGFLVIVEF